MARKPCVFNFLFESIDFSPFGDLGGRDQREWVGTTWRMRGEHMNCGESGKNLKHMHSKWWLQIIRDSFDLNDLLLFCLTCETGYQLLVWTLWFLLKLRLCYHDAATEGNSRRISCWKPAKGQGMYRYLARSSIELASSNMPLQYELNKL
ncbi:hypothetical protein L1987_61250 [Smallanthus sonchifolius]|uniref:Uncharacterized protein n=1 Tax=Smallanthus sonchifolius TaxID=185202 RepID=A0ACB9DAP2_9ASTR|nr:hypothetical protein L1987_61250 [Smallanthus sonchifolius]